MCSKFANDFLECLVFALLPPAGPYDAGINTDGCTFCDVPGILFRFHTKAV